MATTKPKKRTPKQEARSLILANTRLLKKFKPLWEKERLVKKQLEALHTEREQNENKIARLLSPFKVRQVLTRARRPPQHVKVTSVVYLRDEPHFAVYGKRCRPNGELLTGVKERRLDVTDWIYEKPAVPSK